MTLTLYAATFIAGYLAGYTWGKRKPRRPDYEPYS